MNTSLVKPDQMLHDEHYRWWLLALAVTTNMIVVAVSSISLSVLLPDITRELGLTLVQAGWVWGLYSFPAIFMGLVGGSIGDRFGPRKLLAISCIVVGLFGALRGVANSFAMLALASLLFGIMTSVVSMNNLKMAGMWFYGKQLGLASGLLAGGMALGFMFGSLSGTYLSAWLGGWRNVFFFLGAVALLFAIPWHFSRATPQGYKLNAHVENGKTILEGIKHVAGLRELWLIGFSALAANGAVQGLMGYLPLYLTGLGWSKANATLSLTVFTLASAIFVLPISLWSDRLGSRKIVMLVAQVFTLAGLVLLAFGQGNLVWPAVALAGLMRDGYMAVMLASVIESKGVGAALAGTATGFVMIFIGTGNLLAPPLGNSTAVVSGSMPFVVWMVMVALGLAAVLLLKGRKKGEVLSEGQEG